MPSERIQRQIDRLLDQVEEALEQRALDVAREKTRLVLGMDAENADAVAYLAAIDSAQAGVPPTSDQTSESLTPLAATAQAGSVASAGWH